MHIFHINTGFFTHRYGKCLICCVNFCYSFMWLDCSFIEHIRLTLKLSILVNNFKCGEQREGTVITESRTIGSAVYQSVFFGECVIQIVQLFLCLFNLLIGIIFFLYFNKVSNAVTNSNHTLDTIFGSCRYYGRRHS